MHSNKRGRTTLLGSLALTLCVTVGLVGAADAAKKKSKKSPNKATVQKTNVPIADMPAGSQVAGVTPVDLVVPKSFGKKQVGLVEVTLQVTGSAVDFLNNFDARLVAPNGRSISLDTAVGPDPNQSYGPTRLTPNSPNGFCQDTTPPCTDPDDVVPYPSYVGTVGQDDLVEFDGVKMKGTWRLKLIDFDDDGITGVLNLVKLEITGAKPPPV